MSPILNGTETATFTRVCKLVQTRRRGLTLEQIADAAAVAEEAGRGTLDSERAALCLSRLGIDVEDVA